MILSRPVTVVALLALTGMVAGQGRGEARIPEAPAVFTCPMHPQLRMAGGRTCPICGMALVAFRDPADAERVSIDPGGLRAFCEEYVLDALADIESRSPDDRYTIIEAYVSLEGREALESLRRWLDSSHLSLVRIAARHLVDLQDRASIPRLVDLLGDERLVFAVYRCHDHPGEYREAGGCPECGRELEVGFGTATLARLEVAGALHRMGEVRGFQDLLDVVRVPGPLGALALGWLTLRDTQEVRDTLAAEAESEDRLRRGYAISGQLRLGIHEDRDAASELAESSVGLDLVLLALAEAGYPEAKPALVRIVTGDDTTVIDRVGAAQALIAAGEDEYFDVLAVPDQEPEGSWRRQLVLDALAAVGRSEHLPIVQQAIEQDRLLRPQAVLAAVKILERDGREE